MRTFNTEAPRLNPLSNRAHSTGLSLLPMRRWWPMVNRASLRSDAMAGLSGTIILLPQAVAYAHIAGMPPEYGLYAAIIPVIFAALFGSSRHLVSGPTAALSIVVFSTISPLAEPGSATYIAYVLTLTFMVGLLQLALAFARMGMLVNFISHSVVIGFTAGAAVLIAVSQLKNFFGLHYGSGGEFFGTLSRFAAAAGDINWQVAGVGAVTLAAGILTKRHLPRVPYMIVAMVIGSLYALGVKAMLGHDAGIETVSEIPRSLPPLSAPLLSMEVLHQLGAIALAVTLLSLTEALSIARAVGAKSGQHIDGNQEFFGQGLANLAGSFFSGYVSSGSFTRSGINYEAGAVTPLSSVFSASFLVLTLLFFVPLARYLPIASMAAILFMVAYALIDVKHIRAVMRTSRRESAVLFATLASTLVFQLEFAIYAGVILSLVLYLERTARPGIRPAVPAPGEGQYHFVPQRDEPDCPQLKMEFIDGELYFGAIDHVKRHLHQLEEVHPEQRHLLVLAPGINFIDASGADLLADEARRRRARGGGLYFHRLNDQARSTLERGGQLEDIGPENLFAIGDDVIGTLYPRLDPQVCANCRSRIFRQCKERLPDGSPR